MRSFVVAAIIAGLLFGAPVANADEHTQNTSRLNRTAKLWGSWKQELFAAASETKISIALKQRELQIYAKTIQEKIRKMNLRAAQAISGKKDAARAVTRERIDALKTYVEKETAGKQITKIQKINHDLAKDIKRLQGIIARLEKRLDTLAKKDRDVSSAKTLLEEAKRQTAEAERAAETTRVSLALAAQSATGEIAPEKIANETQITREKIKTAHQTVIQAINAVK